MGFAITHSSIEGDNMGEKLEKLEKPMMFGINHGSDQKTHFKLYDDDDNCYYTGYYFGDPDSEDAFEPLDWASNHAGCTYIKYRQPDGTYEVL